MSSVTWKRAKARAQPRCQLPSLSRACKKKASDATQETAQFDQRPLGASCEDSSRFSRTPRQYKTSPSKIAATVPINNFASNSTLFEDSPGGTIETAMQTSTTKNPNPPTNHTPVVPPGISTACAFSCRSFRFVSLITAANMYRKGMK